MLVCTCEQEAERLVSVYNNLCVCVRLGVLIHSRNVTPLTCAIFQEKVQGRGPVASAARRFPSYTASLKYKR